MMPIRPFWWDVAGLLLCIAGFAFLALAAEREGHVLLHRDSSVRERLLYRLIGWPLLIAGLALSVTGWRSNFGPVLWFGWLTVAALAVVFAISYWPWRSKRHTPASRSRASKPVAQIASTPLSPWQRAWHALLLVGLVTLPVGVGWSLYHAPVHPLLRGDAMLGHVGPWRFTLAEEKQEGPELTLSGVLVKHLMLRFCDACDVEIRAAYVQLREPGSPRSFGIRFIGEHWEREATMPIPTTITPQDRLWLTVVGKDGQIHRTALEVVKVSPALAHYIEKSNR